MKASRMRMMEDRTWTEDILEEDGRNNTKRLEVESGVFKKNVGTC